MSSHNDCLVDCVRLAGLAKNPDLHEKLMQMAREWMAVAIREEKLPAPQTHTGLGR